MLLTCVFGTMFWKKGGRLWGQEKPLLLAVTAHAYRVVLKKMAQAQEISQLTPEKEAKKAVELFNEGLKTLACACSMYEEWTESTDPCAPSTRHPMYKQVTRTYFGRPATFTFRQILSINAKVQNEYNYLNYTFNAYKIRTLGTRIWHQHFASYKYFEKKKEKKGQ